jgi:hypothetical protein
MQKKILVIRHAEKPDKDAEVHGVAADGSHDKDELAIPGWQRSGALVRFFNPLGDHFPHPGIARPDAIFAAAASGHVTSLRSQHTVEALAKSLGKHISMKFTKGEEKELLKEVVAVDGVALIAWEHKAILDLANLILGDDKSSPQNWPGARYDLVWVFDHDPQANHWKFSQVPQLLLPGDLPHLL